MQKVLQPIRRVRFTKSTPRQASIRERKDHCWERQKSFLVSEVPTLQNSRIGSTKRLHDNSDVPKARLGILPKICTSSKKKTRLHCTFPRRRGYSPAASTKEPEEREFVVDSGASMLTVSEEDLNSAELETMRTSRCPTTVMTPNGEVQTREEATVCVKNWTCSSKLCFLKKLPQFFPWGNSVGIMGIHTTGSVVKNLISSEMAKELIAIYRTLYHF